MTVECQTIVVCETRRDGCGSRPGFAEMHRTVGAAAITARPWVRTGVTALRSRSGEPQRSTPT